MLGPLGELGVLLNLWCLLIPCRAVGCCFVFVHERKRVHYIEVDLSVVVGLHRPHHLQSGLKQHKGLDLSQHLSQIHTKHT